MVNRPPFDRDPPSPPPGGFDPRFGDGPPQGGDPRFGARPHDPYWERNGPFPGRERRETQAPDPFDPRSRSAPPPPPPPTRRGGLSRGTKLLLGLGLLLLLGAIAFAWSLTRAGPGDDGLDGAEEKGANASTASADPEARCAAPAAYDQIKRELFRQAAASRGADVAVFDRLSGYAVLRVTNPVLREEDEGLERVSCAGRAALDLPPGVQVVGGRRTLSANLGYSLQPAADGSGDVVTLTGAEPITAPLATLARVAEVPAASAQPEPVPSSAVPVPEPFPPQPPQQQDAPPPPQAPPPAPAPPQVAPPRTTSANPSFNCARASNRAERAICADSGLASLDRQMASRFFAARGDANATQRVLLDRTRGTFLAYRNRCTNDACIAEAYRGRIREIGDIMADRWVAPR